MRYTINARTTKVRRWRSSVYLPSPPRGFAAFDCDKALLRDAAAGSLDRGAGAGGREHALERELLGQLALLDDLRLLGVGRHELGGPQHGEIDLARRQLVQLVQQHFGGVVLHLRAEADLRQATLHRHLAAFEARLDLALAGTGEGALVAAARGLAEAGTDAATDALALGAGAGGGLEGIHAHVRSPWSAQASTRTR